VNDDLMSDDDVLLAVRHALPAVPVGTPPALEAVVAQGRARRNRRRSLAAVGVAVVVALAIAVPTLSSSAQAPASLSPGRPHATAVHVHLAAFSVDTNPGGTVTVTLTMAQTVDPDAMRQALAQAGVPAVITVGTFCRTADEPHGLHQVFRHPGPDQASAPPAASAETIVITPSALPKDAEVSIGYFPNHVGFTLVTTGEALTCTP
jgi:hypothetical protein